MTNKDKFLKDGVSVEEFVRKLVLHLKSNAIINELNKGYLLTETENFLNEPVQPTLTEDERVILRNIDPMYHYIYRTYGSLRVGIKAGKREENEIFAMYDRLFQFIKERRRI